MRAEQSERVETRARPASLDRIRRAREPNIEYTRVRLLAGLTLIAGIALLLGLPFALRAGAEFLLPVTAAMVIAIALVPLLEWLERRRVPSPIAAIRSAPPACATISRVHSSVRSQISAALCSTRPGRG